VDTCIHNSSQSATSTIRIYASAQYRTGQHECTLSQYASVRLHRLSYSDRVDCAAQIHKQVCRVLYAESYSDCKQYHIPNLAVVWWCWQSSDTAACERHESSIRSTVVRLALRMKGCNTAVHACVMGCCSNTNNRW
jgi:hypothetical protein